MNTDKIEKLKEFKLGSGKHKSIDEGACVMEMVSYFADEPWSDRPKCACQILTSYAIALNDRFNDEYRQKLKDFIPSLVGTKVSDEVAIARKRLIQWRYVTVTYPLLLDMWKLNDIADKLRSFVNTSDDMKRASIFIKENRDKINADAYAYADADDLRKKIVSTSLETLRMAIEIK